ncbi:hypothetical protein [Phenylobacterium sp. SCN 70-31]|uniref:hypothetical protein n=1 Tax=Phenylobacterium sp. SCN 70-31 TaxID=1660129 RepID=UPI0025FE3BCD|nr:hypothetical protein [Phenylobacterium sp. SCN 70-31]
MIPRLPIRMTIGLAITGLILAITLGLYWKGRLDGAARERPKAAAARSQAAVAALEKRGERDSATRAAAAADVAAAAAGSLIDVVRNAQTSEDALAPLDPDRSRRLHAHDSRLCEWAPELAGCASAGDAAAGATTVRPAPPSRRSDTGRP